MTKRLKRLAKSVASRRGFLGKIGQGAAAMAAGLGGLLAFPGDAQAKKDGGRNREIWYCSYDCLDGVASFYVEGQKCPKYWDAPCWGPLIYHKRVKNPPPEEDC